MAEEEVVAAETEEKKSEEKTKKINKLSLDELNKKIGELKDKNQIQSKYYGHLMKRKSELEPETTESTA